jgi:uncharacterized protein YceK
VININIKILGLALIFSSTLGGCGTVVFKETPESWGTDAGIFGAKQWIQENGKSSWPSTDGVAAYCVNIGESGQKEYNWTIEQLIESTDACSKAFVDELVE